MLLDKAYTGQAMFDKLEADIVVMQETKIQRKDLQDDMVLVPGWDVYFSLPKYKKGASPLWLSRVGSGVLIIWYRVFWRGHIHAFLKVLLDSG